jgi:hypothetical protein
VFDPRTMIETSGSSPDHDWSSHAADGVPAGDQLRGAVHAGAAPVIPLRHLAKRITAYYGALATISTSSSKRTFVK